MVFRLFNYLVIGNFPPTAFNFNLTFLGHFWTNNKKLSIAFGIIYSKASLFFSGWPMHLKVLPSENFELASYFYSIGF